MRFTLLPLPGFQPPSRPSPLCRSSSPLLFFLGRDFLPYAHLLQLLSSPSKTTASS